MMATMPSAAKRRQAAHLYALRASDFIAAQNTRVSLDAHAADETAGELLSASASLAATAQRGLESPDPLDVAAAEVQLLAGAALDLLVADRLAGPPADSSRTASASPDELAMLRTIIEAPQAYLVGATAGRTLAVQPARRTRALPDASAGMANAVHAALTGIREDVVGTGSHVVSGLLLLDAALVGEAIALVGRDLGARLGIDLARAGARVLEFVLAANMKILAVAGFDALGAVRQQLNTWLAQLYRGALFPQLADRLLRTRAVDAEIMGWLAAYAGPEAALLTGQDEVSRLAGRYAAKARIADRITAGLALVRIAPPVLTPVGRLAIAAVHLGLLAYVVGSGCDHIDSDRVKLLDRVEGVRGVSQRLLAPE